MSEQAIVTAAQDRIRELEGLLAEANEREARAIEDRRRVEALLAHYKTSLSEQHNDPMRDGQEGGHEA